MDDLSKLTDEELDRAIETGSPLEESPSEVPEEEVGQLEPEEEELVEEQEEKQAEPEEPKADEPREPSRRENLRIQQLLEKMSKKEVPQMPTTSKGMDYGSELDADPDTVTRLEQDRRTYGEELYNQGLEQSKSLQFHTRLEIDAPKVESKYGILNPQDKEKFNPAVANAVNTWYLQAVGYDTQTGRVENSNIRYAEFAEGIMELADRISNQKVAKTAKNIAKQTATTGLRPDGSSAKRLNLNKSPGDMTDEELDAVIGGVFRK